MRKKSYQSKLNDYKLPENVDTSTPYYQTVKEENITVDQNVN